MSLFSKDTKSLIIDDLRSLKARIGSSIKAPKIDLFKKKTIEELDYDLKYNQVQEQKAKARIKTLLSSTLLFILASSGSFYTYNHVQSLKNPAPAACVGYCIKDYNQALSKKGFVTNPRAKSTGTTWIIDYNGDFSVGSAEMFANKIDKVIANVNPNDSLLMRINSPGGDPSACGHDYDQVMRLKAYKVKVIAMVDYMANSCGYLLASSADEIYASSSVSIGNIGAVYGMRASIIDTAIKFLGGKDIFIGSTRAKELLAGAKVETKEDRAFLKGKIIRKLMNFQERVLRTRKDKITDFDKVFSADEFSGTEALELGLIDKISDYRTYLSLEHMHGRKIKQIVYARSSTLGDVITGQLKPGSIISVDNVSLKIDDKIVNLLSK